MGEMEPIAVVGLAFNFPGGADTEERFWKLMLERECVSREFPRERGNIDLFYDPAHMSTSKVATRNAHFLDNDIKEFDPRFFSISQAEASAMDPQHRALMETTYHAIENAGITMQDVAGSRTSVYVGCFGHDHQSILSRDEQDMPKYGATGGSGCILSNRISWFFDLHGASMTVDTACSSSLVAFDLACKGVWDGSADAAIVGGVNLIESPDLSIMLSNMSFLSLDGRCYSFDERGNGYARGEGVASLILKPLSSALRDGNQIRALVRAVGTNQDGHTKGGLTQPSMKMQASLIKETYRKAALGMEDTRYFEAHGTATPVGDPIEARAIGECFRRHRSAEDPIYVGALKSNIGHLEGCSGLAGIVKAVLAIEHKVIPPNANFETMNRNIDAEFFNIHFPIEPIPWPNSSSGIRRASVNSFGFGGTNAHVVLDDVESYLRQSSASTTTAIGINGTDRIGVTNGINGHHVNRMSITNGIHINGVNKLNENDTTLVNGVDHFDGETNETAAANGTSGEHVNAIRSDDIIETDLREGINGGSRNIEPISDSLATPKLLLLTAADESGCQRIAQSLQANLPKGEDEQESRLEDMAYTLNIRRTKFPWKSYALIRSLEDIADLEDRIAKPLRRNEAVPNLAFVFTGQGAQWAGMGREFLRFPIFKESVLKSQEHLEKLGSSWSLIGLLSANEGSFPMDNPRYSQLLTTVVQLGLVDVFKNLNVHPKVVMGHSSGEIAAAYCANLIDQAASIKISYYRGELAARLSEGEGERHSMMSVGLSPAEMKDRLHAFEESEKISPCNRFTISCINSPKSVTVSGLQKDLIQLNAHLDDLGIFARRLQVHLGYHSPQMRQVSSDYIDLLGSISAGPNDSKIRMVSSVTRKLLTVEAATDSVYWNDNMVSQVNFAGAASRCFSQMPPEQVSRRLDQSHLDELFVSGVLEIGPHSTLKGPIRQILESHNRTDSVFYTSALIRDKPADEMVLDACGKLYCENVPVNIELLTSWCRASPRSPKFLAALPKYPFDHSVVYWEESRLNSNVRLRQHGFNKFLGNRVPAGAVSDTRWRIIFRTSEQPWIEHHVINGANAYPGAGMLVMALEAANQLLSDNPPEAFVFENVEFESPILMSDTSAGTEVETCLTPIEADKGSAQYQFRIATWRRDGSSDKVCHGTISADYGRVESEVDRPDAYETNSPWTYFENARKTCGHVIENFYRDARQYCGIDFGPTFQRIKDVHGNTDGEIVATLTPFQDSCIVHPAVLDAAFHAISAMRAGDKAMTLVPRRIKKVWLSASGFGRDNSTQEIIHTRMKLPTKRTAITNISVLRPDTHEIALVVDDFEYKAVTAESEPVAASNEPKRLAGHLVWRPDPDLLTTQEMQAYCDEFRDTREDPMEFFNDWELVCMTLAQNALSGVQDRNAIPPELVNYTTWLEMTIGVFKQTRPAKVINMFKTLIAHPDLLETLCNKVEKQKAGRVYVKVGKSLAQILSGELNPLGVLFTDEQLMNDYYDEMLYESRPLKSMQAYIDVIAHKRPDMKFLEIGAGTGGSTNTILEVLDDWAGPRYGQYVFTDIGPSFLEKARTRFSNRRNMNFRMLDIEKDPLDQGFHENEFDVIVADMVLHATADLTRTMKHVRKILKPGGKLVLKEVTGKDKIFAGFVFGLLPGWWLSKEESRQKELTPCINEDKWDVLLKAHEFSGNDLMMWDFAHEECHSWSYLVSTATEVHQNGVAPLPAPLIVGKRDSDAQIRLSQLIAQQITLTKDTFPISTFSEVASLADLCSKDLIVIHECEEPALVYPTQEFFESLQKILLSARSILWVNQSSYSVSPDYGIVQGLIRVLRVENATTKIITLGLETTDQMRIAHYVSNIFKTRQDGLRAGIDIEPEFMERSNRLNINRLILRKKINEHIFRRTAQPVVDQAVGGSDIKLGIRALGLLDTLEFSEDTSIDRALAANEVLVKVKSIGVNFKDCLTLLGRIDTDALGSECSGEVVRVGSDCGNIVPGMRVIASVFDAYRSFVRTTVDRVTEIPGWMSFATAASIPTASCTAHFSLLKVARLQEGERVLIHAAAGGTGQAAIQLAQSVGAEVFATVGSLAKKQLLMDTYGIPESHIFYSRDTSFADKLMDATDGEGLDVILNSLAGKQLHASWDIIANFGRFVEIGRSDIDSRKLLPMHSFGKNASFTGVDLTMVMGEGISPKSKKRNMGTVLSREVMSQVEAGRYKAVQPIHEFAVDSIEQALRFIQSGKSSGKIVVNVSEESIVPVVQGPHSSYRLRSDATYIICGGLGGLGRAIADWLCERGARNLILLSRSGANGEKAQEVVQRLNAQGVTVECPVCDITDFASLQRALATCAHLPPIRGCFQGAMVLRDSTFAKMTYEQWITTTLPKVQGSWNLHLALESTDLDFFILLSSAGAIFGNAGQSNYSAGNSFQDALARYRNSRGQPALALNLGMVFGQGYVAENDAVRERLVRKGELVPIMLNEFLAMLDYCCNPDLGVRASDESQLVTGIVMPNQLRAEGNDVPPLLLQPMFRCVWQIPVLEAEATAKNDASRQDLMAAFQAPDEVSDAGKIATEILQMKTSRLLGIPLEDIKENSHLEHYGVDSLVAIELRNWIAKELGVNVAVFEILGGMTLVELGMLLAQRRTRGRTS